MKRPVLISANPRITEPPDGVFLTAGQVHLGICRDAAHIPLVLADEKGKGFAQAILSPGEIHTLIASWRMRCSLIGAGLGRSKGAALMPPRTRPLPFSDPMVLAIKREIEKPGTGKTQTRRLLRAIVPPPEPDNFVCFPTRPAPCLDAYCDQVKSPWNPRGMGDWWCRWTRDDRPGSLFKVSYRPGDVIWLKETYAYPNDQVTIYRADWHADAKARGLDNVPETDEGIRWQSSRFMPRRDSHFVLEITEVRVQRLHDITEKEAKAEGWPGPTTELGYPIATPLQWFARLWDELH